MEIATELSIIILNWNAAADTISCVQNFDTWQQIKPTIWVVDNPTGNNSADEIAQACPHVHLVRNPSNVGYTAGNNRGLEKALAHGDAPIMLLNNDALIAEKDVAELLKTFQEYAHIGIVGPLMFDSAQPERLLNAGGQNMVKHLSSHISSVTTTEPLQMVDYIPGTVLLARTEVFNSVGLLDEDYFFGGELPDLCHRAQQQGFLSAVNTQARAYHAVARSSTFRETLYPYYIIRNRFIFIRKFYGVSKIFYMAFWTLYSTALSFKLKLSGQPHTAKAVQIGLVDGWQKKFGGQNERVMAACKAAAGKSGSQS